MARVSIAHVVLFIAVVGASTLFVGVVVTESSLYAQSVGDEADRTAAAIDADIEIVNDPQTDATYDAAADELTLYVKNVGGDTLEPAALELLVDGEYAAESSTRVLAEHDSWRPGTVLEVTATPSLESGDHRALVTLDGATAVHEFESTAA